MFTKKKENNFLKIVPRYLAPGYKFVRTQKNDRGCLARFFTEQSEVENHKHPAEVNLLI